MSPYFLRPARPADAEAIASVVELAYTPYIERIGRKPGPMLENYAQVVAERHVTVAERGGEVIGVLVLVTTEEGFLLDNIAVHPEHRGGLGKALLQYAESECRRQGFPSIYLYTHQKMTENQALYSRIG
jgi:N-acetylglutamate synthase-like GNAT family acetyltransferase